MGEYGFTDVGQCPTYGLKGISYDAASHMRH